MSKPTIKSLEARNAELEAQVAARDARLANAERIFRELKAELAVEQSANRALGIKLKQQIARGNYIAARAA